MKYILSFILIGLLIYSCDSSKSTFGKTAGDSQVSSDTIRIANDSLEYEVIIIDPGFNSFLATQPSRGYHGLAFLEIKNKIWTAEYNYRVNNVQQFNRNLYVQQINYDPNISYGYEVNYLLYNYLLYFQRSNNQKFPGGRI